MAKIFGNKQMFGGGVTLIALSATEIASGTFDVKLFYDGDYGKLNASNFMAKFVRMYWARSGNGSDAHSSSGSGYIAFAPTYNASTGIVTFPACGDNYAHWYNQHAHSARYIPYLIIE